jgi:hypothetical protein
MVYASNIMLEHYLQREIIYQLSFRVHARFSELQPDRVENKLFTYHLKKVVGAGYVEKNADGLYSLTPKGRRLGTGAAERQDELVVERAHSVLFLVIRRASDGAWLLYRRGTYPMLGYGGFMHANPDTNKEAHIAAAEACREKTRLTGDFTALGSGYFRVFEREKLESFTHFTLLYCDDIQGDLQPHDDKAEYFWSDDPLASSHQFPGTELLMNLYVQKQPFFVERTFAIEA